MAFLRNLLAAILGTLIALGIVFIMFMIFISLVNAGDKIVVKNGSILTLEIPDTVSEYVGYDASDPFAGFFEASQGLNEITKAIKLASEDKNIRGISIHNTYLLAGISQTKAIRDALEEFKSSGKFVYAYGDFFTQKDYYLVSVADSIFLNPSGEMDFRGLSAEVLYLKDIQEKSGIKMEVVRHGKYKSAVEPYLTDEMSQENRTQLSALLEDIWSSLRDQISESRDIEVQELDQIADTLGARTPNYALKNGLIDGIRYYDQYEASLSKASGKPVTDLNFISLTDYISVTQNVEWYKGKDRIAVIYAQGEILYGEGGPEYIGQGLINKALRNAREDEDIKAVVIRVNSPGGSALTSELIWREIQLTKAVKPVVVSMSDVAASGGYYIAVGANRIFAEPTTITGSIGVFGTIPNIYELSENIGINSEQVGTHQHSVAYTPFEPMSDAFRKEIQEGIEDTYQTFLRRVADGRDITVAHADSMAQGRVWSGQQALNVGLVDELGGLDDAITAAAELGGTDDFRIKLFPKYKSGFERFMEDFGGAKQKSARQYIQEEFGAEWALLWDELKIALKQEGVQARLPYTLKIR